MDEKHNETTGGIEIQTLQTKRKKLTTRKGRWTTKPRIVKTQSNIKKTEVKPSNIRPTKWSSMEIFYLIRAYKYIAQQEVKGNSCLDPSELWSDISKRLSARNFHHTPEQCRTKWTLLSKLYYSIQHKYQKDKFEFFDPLHDFYKDARIEILCQQSSGDSNITPKPRRICKSLIKLPNNENEIRQDELETIVIDDDIKTTKQTDDLTITPEKFCLDEICSEGEHLYEEVEIVDNDQISLELFPKEDEVIEDSIFQMPKISSDELPEYIRKLNEIVEKQEEKREARHSAKMAKFSEFCEQLLAQREEAMQLYKHLMEQLIDKL